MITILQSCIVELCVVNIPKGFGAEATTILIANRVAKPHI